MTSVCRERFVRQVGSWPLATQRKTAKYAVNMMSKLVPPAKFLPDIWPSFWLRSDVVCPPRGQPIPYRTTRRLGDLACTPDSSEALKKELGSTYW